ncbi:MAG: mechanosensitive ion channel family protein [Gammaproteobacteria bacterium]|nr:mechanosensitive ion channel family protein [Gammaproteobacteria bacterium]
MNELLSQTYYQNTLQEWLIGLGIIVGSVVLGRAVYWVFSKIVRTFTSRSKTEFDDIIVDMVEEPVVFMIIASGIWFGLRTLTLPERLGVAIGNSYHVIVALLVGWLASRLFDALYKQYLIPLVEKSETDLDDQLAPIISKGVKIIIWSMAFIIGMNNAGYDVAALIAGLGIGGLALAMAAKDTVSNIFGGFTIFTDKPFNIGDRIKVSGFDGTVNEIGLRSTRLKTLDGRIVTIPNSTFADSAVENVSWEPSRKVVLNIGLVYDTTPDQIEEAMATLKQIADDHPGTEEDTWMAFNAFGDFALNICFIYYIRKGEDIGATQTQINLAILRTFNEKKLEMAFPTQTLINVNG